MSKDKVNILLPVDYADWISSLKKRIAGARQRIVLSADLRDAFPEMKGFSASNLKYMRFFAQECPDIKIGQQPADQLPWFHIVTLITKITDSTLRGWYARETVKQAWSRDTLVMHIRNQLHLRQGAAVTNFNRRLKCYVVVELKSTAFKPEHAGQLNFYLAAVDAQIKATDDKPTIGLLLCKTRKRLVAEYALSGIDKPIGVAEYQLVRALPVPLDTSLPSVEEIEAELSGGGDG
ncbi:MAG: DUF1016 family protein [Euryarchaeota archaeon]|nr:DUF1016 family protein [Euryarchaeota archaeon]MBU4139337.1 DUF1016 family protein [Euryarchaeota archaeon]